MNAARQRWLPLVLVVLGAWPSTARAHVLDEYLQSTLVAIGPERIRLHINLTPGVEIADKVIPLIDRDGDGVVSNDEATAYIEALHQDFLVRLDGREAELTWKAVSFPPVSELRTGHGIIQVECALLSRPLASGPHRLVVENRHFSTLGAYLFNAARPESGLIEIKRQQRNQNQSTGEIEFAYSPAPASGLGGTKALCLILLVAVLTGFWWFRRGRHRPGGAL